jgi:histidinol-phosphatase (PHP family)
MHADYHIHTNFSGDCETPMKEMIDKGLSLGLETMCFTEHMDYGWPYPEINFEADVDAYYKQYLEYKELFKNHIELLFGIELGLQPFLAKKHEEFIRRYPFDFIIGSSHLVHGKDPYYPEYFLNKSEDEAYYEYFESILDNLNAFSDFQVYGHLDYIVRYGPNKAAYYSYTKYKDIIDKILMLLIQKGIGLEVNTGAYKYGLSFPNPHPHILSRYRELGGDIITLGSDAHVSENLAYHFRETYELLKSCGFKYYTQFRQKEPVFIKL